ncbi:hypothetical protein N7540_001099 [Penicillium herquei]|nr:hypothetical protein N7540_001099 [Penicillium herquei]
MDSSKPNIPPSTKGFPNAKVSEDTKDPKNPKPPKRIPARRSNPSLGHSATAARQPSIKSETESDYIGLDTKTDATYANCANFKHGLKRKREASEFFIRMMGTRRNQLEEIDKELTAAKGRRLQIEKEHQRSGAKLQEAKSKVDEIQKSNLNYPFRMKEAQMEIEAIKKRRDDLLDSVEPSTFSRIFGTHEEG